jgi:hypothetical protein
MFCQQPDGLFVGGIQRFDHEVLDPGVSQHPVVADSIFWRACDHKVAPGTGVTLLKAFRKVVFEFRLNASFILGKDEPPGHVSPEYCVIRTPKHLTVTLERYKFAANIIARAYRADQARAKHDQITGIRVLSYLAQRNSLPTARDHQRGRGAL